MNYFLSILLIGLVTCPCLGQIIIKDEHTRRQIQRLTHTRWEKFTPRAYFEFFHRSYRRGEDRRIMRQWLPVAASLEENTVKTDEEKKDMTEVTSSELLTQAALKAKVSYHLHFAPRLSDYKTRLAGLMVRLEQAGAGTDILAAGYEEAMLLAQAETLLLESPLLPGPLEEGLRALLTDWQVLTSRIARLVRLQEILSNLQKPTP
jgi:hypothetical protein